MPNRIMATLTTTPSSEVLQALPLLKELVTNHSVGVIPHVTVQRIRDLYGIDLLDLRASAIGPDKNEQQMLDLKALERAAYAMGRNDGVRLVASRRGLSAIMDQADMQAILSTSDQIPREPAAYKNVIDSYAHGMRAAAAYLYVARTNPLERRRQVAEARIVRSQREPAEAEALVEMCKGELRAAEASSDFDAYAVALSAHAMAEEAANSVAEEALLERVSEIAQTTPSLTAMEVLQRARLSYRMVGDGATSQRANARCAWMPVSMRTLKERVVAAQSLERQQQPVFEAPSARRAWR